MNPREKYAIGQHDLACDDLDVGKSGDDPGPSLHERVRDFVEAATALMIAAEVMLEQTTTWNKAVEKIIGRCPDTGISLQGPQQAINRLRSILPPWAEPDMLRQTCNQLTAAQLEEGRQRFLELSRQRALEQALKDLATWSVNRTLADHDPQTTLSILERKVAEIRAKLER